MGSSFLDGIDLDKLPRMTMKEALALNEKEGLVPMELPEDVLNGERKIIVEYAGTEGDNLIRGKVRYQK